VSASTNKKDKRGLRGGRNVAGVFFTPTALLTATGKLSGDTVVVLREESVTPVPDGATHPFGEAAAQLRKQLDPRDHRIVTAVGCEDVLFQTLEFPTVDNAEMRQMLNLQIDSITPLPLEDVVCDFIPLERRGDNTRVLVAVARKDAVNQRVAALEEAGLPPESVTVDGLAIFRTLMQRGLLPGDDKFNLLVLLNRDVANVIVYRNGQPRSVRSVMLDAGALDDAEGQAGLLAELQRTLMSDGACEPESETGLLTLMTFDAALRSSCEAVARAWDGRVEFLNNGSAPTPALSLCIESAAVTERLNLLPDEWRQKRHAARIRHNLMRAGIGILFVYLVGLVIFLSMLTLKGNELNKLLAEERQLKPAYNDALKLHAEYLAVTRQLDDKFSALELLHEASVRLPGDIELNLFALKTEKVESKDRKVLRVRGRAKSFDSIHAYIGNLQKCEQFEKVEPGKFLTQPDGWTSFDITCLLVTVTAAGGKPHGN
jgi:hypothetical protein